MAPILAQDRRVAIIIPVYRHSVLVVDAIEAALAQVAPFDIVIILVNDGCPNAETDNVCHDYATLHGDRIVYIRKPNGGLSSARNAGIRYVLKHLPSVEACYFLDADNALRPTAMAKGMAVLDANPQAGWVYPNIDMFGMAWHGEMGGDYSLLLHADTNICEAGSLVRRTVFDAGLLFDESFELGWEDWDFFLSAAEKGFVGVNCEDFGFLYRKRPESMLANSARDHAAIRAMMHRKHAALMKTRNLLALEQAECPRFAILLADRREVMLAVDPQADGMQRLSYDAFERMFARHAMNPNRHFLPPFMIMTTSWAFETLSRAGLLRNLLWHMERGLQSSGFVAVDIDGNGEDRIRMERAGRQGGHETAAVFGGMTRTIVDAVKRKAMLLFADDAASDVLSIQLSLPGDAISASDRPWGGVIYDYQALFRQLCASAYQAAWGVDWEWRTQTTTPRPHTHLIARHAFQGEAVFPHVDGAQRNIGFILPLVEFGGVEKVALNMARGMRAHGWIPHLFIVGVTDIHWSADWQAAFETVTFLDEPAFDMWSAAQEARYFGTDVPDWAMGQDHGKALSMLHWLDAVVTCHAGAMLGTLGQLRRMGVKTVASLHVSDMTAFGRSKGNTYLAAAFEHAIDIFAPCSLQLADWCHAMGVPSAKIAPVENVGGYEEELDRLMAIQTTRRERASDAPLRILFLGRFDRQKGIDRLLNIFSESKARALPVEWRIIGKSVLVDGQEDFAAELEAIAEPPLMSEEELTRAYGWADLLLLPSLYEGLPLTVLEAMRAGVVPIVTDVGAVREAVTDGHNGFVLPLDGLEQHCVEVIEQLCGDRAMLLTLSEQAFVDRAGRNWIQATKTLSDRLT